MRIEIVRSFTAYEIVKKFKLFAKKSANENFLYNLTIIWICLMCCAQFISAISNNEFNKTNIDSESLVQNIEHTSNNNADFLPITREFIAMLNNETQYNRYARPTQYDGIATNVSMSMYIEGISSFSAQTMDYHLDMYFYQEWNDHRLKHNGTGPLLIRDKKIFKLLWHPDIYFANARYASFQEITEDNFLVWVYPSGRVWYDCRISLVAICMMNLWKYPLDSQSCELRILSYAYPESQLRLRWSIEVDPPIDRNSDIRMPDMRLVDIKTGTCNGTYVTGTWSCMTAIFYVQREMMHHIIQTYVPTIIIVIISWFNFWLDIDSAPARVSLSITTLLTIATQANAVKLALPEVSYMKAIDMWLGICMSFVFGVMLEYTIAHYAKNQENCNSVPSNLLVDSTLSTLYGVPTANNVENSTLLNDLLKVREEMEHCPPKNPRSRQNFKNGEQDFAAKKRSIYSNEEYEIKDTFDGNYISLVTKNSNENILNNSLNNINENSINARLKVPFCLNAEEECVLNILNGKCRTYNKPKESKLRNMVSRRAHFMKHSFCNLRGRVMANKIDQKSRIVFPAAFIIVNICYWSFYLVFN